MNALPLPDIESELSYAYLHAVASKAGMSCKVDTRHADNNGIDAQLTAWGPFPNGGYLNEIDLKIQLKATKTPPADDGTHLSYFLRGVRQYDDLRAETVAIPRILVVLFLPEEPKRWLQHSVDELILRRCAYWESLRGAPSISTSSGTTVKMPKKQIFSPEGLAALAARLSRRDVPLYPHHES